MKNYKIVFATALIGIYLFFLPINLIARTDLIDKIQKSHSKLISFRAHFTQETYDVIQDKISKSEGVVEYRKPGLMRWDYKIPEEQLIVIGSEKIWIYDPLLENVTIQKLTNVPGISSMFIFRKEENLKKNYRQIKPKSDYLDLKTGVKKIFLEPIIANPNYSEIQLAVDQKGYYIKEMVIIDSQGNYRKFVFDKMNFEALFDPEYFVFKILEGMEIID